MYQTNTLQFLLGRELSSSLSSFVLAAIQPTTHVAFQSELPSIPQTYKFDRQSGPQLLAKLWSNRLTSSDVLYCSNSHTIDLSAVLCISVIKEVGVFTAERRNHLGVSNTTKMNCTALAAAVYRLGSTAIYLRLQMPILS